MRTDQIRKMQRYTAVEPNYEENQDIEAHLAHTLLKQAHVCPSLHSNVIPDFDFALRIDESVEFFFNPGHFSRYSSFVTLNGKDLKPEICFIE